MESVNGCFYFYMHLCSKKNFGYMLLLGLGDVFVSRGLVYLRRCTYVSASRSRSDELSKVAGGYDTDDRRSGAPAIWGKD